MRVFAISDLHLSLAFPKEMDIFGDNWIDHWGKIRDSWQQTVSEDDVVLVPGDISWAMKLDDAMLDLNSIAEMPGQKILLRGNHDYWWQSISKVRSALPKGMYALQNDCVEYDAFTICGTRGWTCPGNVSFSQSDNKIYEREVARLRMSLSAARKGKPIIAMLHYPPFNEKRQPSGFTEALEEFQARRLVYGHLHGKSHWRAFEGDYNGIDMRLVSCDYLDFKVKEIDVPLYGAL
ncbi:MAG: metallophosphoesterase [Christensenellales bacterium]|jgi:predicted phosphohydrolase